MSQLGWIDFSPAHRNTVILVMDLFKEQGVINELGLGTIRQTISDLIFPGTTTIQTRAKYFWLIPWILQDIESRGKIDCFQSELGKPSSNPYRHFLFLSIFAAAAHVDSMGYIGAFVPIHP